MEDVEQQHAVDLQGGEEGERQVLYYREQSSSNQLWGRKRKGPKTSRQSSNQSKWNPGGHQVQTNASNSKGMEDEEVEWINKLIGEECGWVALSLNVVSDIIHLSVPRADDDHE